MLEEISLLDELRDPGYEAAIITTYNVHIPFLEDVIVRRLSSAGCRHIVVLADHDQLIAALAADQPRSSGRDYILVPMRTVQAFHPKVLLLAGKAKGLLAIGSHNATFAGYGHNREVTNVVRYGGKAGVALAPLFRDAWKTLEQWVGSPECPASAEVATLVRRVSQMAEWLDQTGVSGDELPNIQVLFGDSRSESLYQRFLAGISVPVRQLTVVGAFFDRQLRLLESLIADLNPASAKVLVQPETIELSGKASSLGRYEFRSADRLGPSESRYLHAKLLHVVDANGTHHLASGSANPSAPAWLRTGSDANWEAVVSLRGSVAEQAVAALGLEAALSGQPLSDADWQAIIGRTTRDTEKSADKPESWDIGIAVRVDAQTLEVDTPGPAVDVHALVGDSICDPSAFRPEVRPSSPKRLCLTVPIEKSGPLVCLYQGRRLVRVALVHDLDLLAEHARSGVQRRFRASFASLDSDEPALNELFRCIENVLDDETTSAPQHQSPKSETPEGPPDKQPDTLAVHIADLSGPRRRNRLTAGSDLGYILDILIRSLGTDLPISHDGLDSQGRDEEGQVGSDDECEPDPARTEAMAAGLLRLCHRKIHKLVSRSLSLLNAFGAGRSVRFVIPRITAVLAVLRQLRAQDRGLWWIDTARGQSTVPDQELTRLMQGVADKLIGHPVFADVPDDEDSDVLTSEEYARLRGLIFWLGAITGVAMQLRAGFNESRKERDGRFRDNARFLALAEMLGEDQLSIDEAETAIGTTNATFRVILQRAIELRRKLVQARSTDGGIDGTRAMPGDIAFHPQMPQLGFRLIRAADASRVSLADSAGEPGKTFEATRVRCIPASGLESSQA